MTITHASGLARQCNNAIVGATLLFSIIAMFALVYFGSYARAPDVTVASWVYAGSLIACAFCSFMYTTRTVVSGRRLWRHLDHAAIFLLIAGTYTPFSLTISGIFGLRLVYLVWVLALTGVVLRLLIRRGYERLFVGLYVLIGWQFLVALPEVGRTINNTSLWLLGLGALAYTVGAALFARDIGRWTDPVWHGFVLLAAYLHFLAVLQTVILPAI